MNIAITFDDGRVVVLPSNTEMVKSVTSQYPEMSMMVAMEELSELIIALSKGIRNGSKDKLDNIAEEMTDVCALIMWAIRRFNITPDMLQKWVDYKNNRNIERDKEDSLIFRSDEARDQYYDTRVNPNTQLLITRMKDGKYTLHGNVKDIAEYFHVLETGMLDNMKREKPDKISKKDAKDLDKLLEKASKKAKDVDKKPSKKKDSKKDDKKKKDSKKGKKDKK